ncbi:GNAT family N-acetyltransferase [Streptomyces sp. ISL-43]|uniref:GNAT family N-acetyltransferase n=1 Tax=Streptomyces sp. ISL-43 TaxID=2819183 RepID=UPI001BEB01E1|nr:N-acetyltransferase [Streptomyces sp. ISL-43]MBT2449050.1 GNAT family N-acetyltransferase [Streptomyces sp. ISL-43]
MDQETTGTAAETVTAAERADPVIAERAGLVIDEPAAPVIDERAELVLAEPTTPVILDALELAADPERAARFAAAAHRILAELVAGGAALGWVAPPAPEEVAGLLEGVVAAAGAGDAGLRAAYLGRRLVGLGYWQRYARPTHRPHADLEKIAVDAAAHGRGVGRALTTALIEDARTAGIEVLTLDARGDNTRALRLYTALGFTEYGRLPDFVAVGERRYDKVFCMLDFRGGPRLARSRVRGSRR